MTRSDQAARPYLRTPAISPNGEQIAFVYATDIWLVDADGGAAERFTAHQASSSSPLWTPDGQALAFNAGRTGNGEIYVQSLDGSPAVMLTAHSSDSTPEAWSPDGAFLYFSSAREAQGSAIYRVACAGGVAVPWLAQPYSNLEHVAVSPDGRLLAVNHTRDSWWRRGPNLSSSSDLWLVDNQLAPMQFRRLGGEYSGRNRWPLWRADGLGVYVVSDRDGTENMWLLPLDAEPQQITQFHDGRLLWPSISADGRVIVFERNLGLWRLDLPGGAAAPLAVRVRAATKHAPVRMVGSSRDFSELTLSPDGKKLAFIAHGDVFVDFADKETEKERRQGAAFRVTTTAAREDNLAWSSDSRALVYSSDRSGERELFRYDIAARSETRLPTAEGAAHTPTYSPDGAWLAYACGYDQIRLIGTATGEERGFARANFTRNVSFAWSPDSRWIVFAAQDEQAFMNLYAQQIEAISAQQISFLSNHGYGTLYPLWSPDGSFVVATTRPLRDEKQIVRIDVRPRQPQFREDEFEKLFAEPKGDEKKATAKAKDESAAGDTPSDTSGNGPSTPKPEPAKPVEIVFAGIDRRLTLLTSPQLDAFAWAISPDSRDLLFASAVAGKNNIWALALDDSRVDQPARQLTSTTGWKSNIQFAPDGKSIYYTDGGSAMVRKFPNGEPVSIALSAETRVDFQQEKLQLFDEAWRTLRDLFYDPTFRGMDWATVRATYLPFVVGAQSYDDVRAILNLMIGELRASHTGVFGRSSSIDEGYLGLRFDPAAQIEGRLVVTGVLPEGPAALAGVRPGEELRAIDGVPIDLTVPFESLLQRTVGRRVRLQLAKSDGSDRGVPVRPISFWAYSQLRYRDWVETNERYVHQESGGRLGYVHIRSMESEDYRRLLVDIDAEMYNRAGIVIDIRNNPGGSIASFILDVFARRKLLRHGFRDLPTADSSHFHGNRVIDKPTVLVVNEQTGSNAEIFTESYRRMGLGSIVGRPTAGAVISTHQHTLLNGNTLRVPQFRVTTVDGEDLEGTGRAVDINVALPLGSSAHTRDQQLDTAVRVLLARIEQQ